jgi:type IV secretion system protein VirB10
MVERIESPNELVVKPNRPKVTKLSRNVAIAGVGVVAAALLVVVIQVATRKPPGPGSIANGDFKLASADDSGKAFTTKAPDTLLTAMLTPPTAVQPDHPKTAPAQTPAAPAQGGGQRAQAPDHLATERQSARWQALEQARLAQPPVANFAATDSDERAGIRQASADGQQARSAAPQRSAARAPQAPPERTAQATPGSGFYGPGGPAGAGAGGAGGFGAGGFGAGGAGNFGGGFGAAQNRDPYSEQNQPDAKSQFIDRAEARGDTPYLESVRKAPLSPLEIKTGTLIPAEMISAPNSDLPGEITAIVRENVYDTATGNQLLIPQGTKLFGRYDSRITYGQRGLTAVWNRLIFPDASTLELGGMQGYDEQGQSGFRDEVDEHWLRIIGSALLTSIFTAGVELSQLQQQNANTNQSITTQNQVGQTVGQSLGQGVGQLGTEITRKQLNIQPTITIRNGYRFNVIVNKDIVFPEIYAQD